MIVDVLRKSLRLCPSVCFQFSVRVAHNNRAVQRQARAPDTATVVAVSRSRMGQLRINAHRLALSARRSAWNIYLPGLALQLLDRSFPVDAKL